MMMNPDAESASCGNMVPLPAAPRSLFLPVMDQLESSSFLMRPEQLGSNNNGEANVPTLLAPASNAAADYNSHDIFPFYSSASHYLAADNPYSHHLARSTHLPTPLECYIPSLLDGNMASFGATPYAQLGLNSLNYGGYSSYYLPPRGRYGNHPPRCQVDGCTADLAKAKRYHRRHRVCEHHSKAPVVITARAIMPQRFCQQCSRFHEVDEFDDGKKSCRQRLADHNRRRRKPKPSGIDVPLKMGTHVKRLATAKHKGSNSKNMGTGNVLGAQELGSASKTHNQSMGLGEVVMRELVDPKGKAPMRKQQAHISLPNLQLAFPLLSSPGNGTYCLPQSQSVSGGGSTSNIAQVQEPAALAFHQHYQQDNILQLGQAVFDLDFDH